HPLWVYLSSLAGSDALLTLTIALSVLAAMALAERPTWWRAFLLALAIGVGASTKLSPLAMSVPLAGLGAAYLVWAWRNRGRDRLRVAALGWRLLPQPIVAYAVFVVSYPYLWPDPIGRTLTLFRFRAKEMANQGAIWSELNVTGPADALSRIGVWLGGGDTTTGRLANAALNGFGVNWQSPGVDLPLAVAGGIVLMALVIRHGLASRHALAAVILGGQVALIVVGMRADFARYLLPVVLTEAVCIGVLGGEAWAAVREWVARRGSAMPADANPAEPAARAS
ncbi:MAG: hypothetical protein IT337_17715, partial [Thermomicrobiales bacterium]|nr:hypothetical protein [Thermomicrobiales bacterium]